MKVAVLMGGRSLERAVSLRSGARVVDAVEALGHEVVAIDAEAGLVGRLRDARPDVAFIALHGPGGEDGTVQELLQLLSIPYTGPGVAACIRCMDKVVAKHLIRGAGVPTPEWVSFNSTAFRELGVADALAEIELSLGMPLVVKPTTQGSALGVRFAADASEVPAALIGAFSYGDRVLIERHVTGRELAITLLDGEALPIVEVIPNDADRFSYEARYEIGRSTFECPAKLEPALAAAAVDAAKATWDALGCSGLARVDLILEDGGGPQVLEVNAAPGMTDTSLAPIGAEAAGLSFEAFVARAIEVALANAAET